MATLPYFTAAKPTFLFGGGISSSDTTIKLTSLVTPDGTALTTADLDSGGTNVFYLTIEPSTTHKETISATGVTQNGDGTATLTGCTRGLRFNYPYTVNSALARSHSGGSSVVLSDSPQMFQDIINYINGIAVAGAPPATNLLAGIARLSLAAVSASDPIVVGDNDPRMLSSANATAVAALISSMPGVTSPYAGRTAPSGWLLCDGSAVSRSTYSTLFGIIAPSAVFTVTIASPGIFSKVGHGLVAGDRLHFTTTGGLPSGLSTNTDYYVVSAGLTADAFEVALTPGGVAINTTGSQSGVHTYYASAFGRGDGSTTFNLPDLRSRISVGLAAAAPTTQNLSFEPASVNTGTDAITIIDTVFPAQGQKVQLTSTGTLPAGLSLATDYYVVRLTSTTIQFGTTQEEATTPSPVNITDQGTGVHTMTFTGRAHSVMGRMGGEETHAISKKEQSSAVPLLKGLAGTGGGFPGVSATGLTVNNLANAGSTITPSIDGSNNPHNNFQPFIVLNYIIKT